MAKYRIVKYKSNRHGEYYCVQKRIFGFWCAFVKEYGSFDSEGWAKQFHSLSSAKDSMLEEIRINKPHEKNVVFKCDMNGGYDG